MIKDIPVKEFASLCKLNTSTVYEAVRNKLLDSYYKGQVRLTTEKNIAYAAARGFNAEAHYVALNKPPTLNSILGQPEPSPKLEPENDEPDSVQRKCAGKYGLPTNIPTRLELEYLKDYHAVDKLRTDNAKKRGELISRTVVERMIASIDSVFSRIIMDGASKLVSDIYAKARAGEPLEKVQFFYRQEISKYLKPVKPALIRILKKEKKLDVEH